MFLKKYKEILKFIRDKDIISAWGYSLSNLLFGVLVLPFILTKLSSPEINVWLLFLSILSFSELAVMGFNTTLVRFYSYTNAGIYYKDFENIRIIQKRNTTELIDKVKQFNDLYTITVVVMGIITILYFLLITIGGYFFLKKPIGYLENSAIGWYAWIILIIANIIRVFFYTYPVILQGMNFVTKYYTLQTIVRTLNTVFSILILLTFPSLLNLAIVYSGSIVILSLLFYYFVKIKNIQRHHFHFTAFKRDFFLIIWDSAWKSGAARITAPIILHASGIIFSQVANPALSSSYLLTQRVFNILQNISNTIVNSKLPLIAMLRGKKEFGNVNKVIKNVSLIGYSIILIGYFVIFLLGERLLVLIGSNTGFVSAPILVLFSFAYLLNRNLGIQLSLANQANKVLEHKAILIYGIVYFLFIGINFSHLDIWVFPVAMIVGILVSMVYTFPKSYSLYNTNFWAFERKSFLPILLIMGVFNILALLN